VSSCQSVMCGASALLGYPICVDCRTRVLVESDCAHGILKHAWLENSVATDVTSKNSVRLAQTALILLIGLLVSGALRREDP